jgi:hypothetical protein
MRTRADIPDPEQFTRQLDALVALGSANRRAQTETAATDAEGGTG